MSTKTKVVISIIGLCVILAVIAVSIVLALTAPAQNINASSFMIKYTPNGVVANVKVSTKDVNLYSTGSGENGIMENVIERCNYDMTALSSAGESGKFDLGTFNNGQYIDMTKADTSLIIDVALDSTTISGSPIVKLYYADNFEKDYNIKFVISGKIFSDKTSLPAIDIPEKTYSISGDNFNNINLFTSSTRLESNGYNKLRLTCTAKIVSYTETSARLDGNFVLSLNV